MLDVRWYYIDDAHLARLKAPTGDQAEKAGEKAAYEARLNVDEAVCHTLLLFPILFTSWCENDGC